MDSYDYAQTDREALAKAEAALPKVGDNVKIIAGVNRGREAVIDGINFDLDQCSVRLATLPGSHAVIPITVSLRWVEVIDKREVSRYAEIQEGDNVVLRAKVARADSDQAFIEFTSMEGPFSVRVPLSELLRVGVI